MDFNFHQTTRGQVAELKSDRIVIGSPDDTLDLMAEAGYSGAKGIIAYEHQITSDFFDLKTRLAGEILQKFSNYRMQLAIIGDFSKYRSKSLRDFIGECNRGNRIFFTDSLKDALEKLSGS